MFALLALKKEGWDLCYLEDRISFPEAESLEKLLISYQERGTPILLSLDPPAQECLLITKANHHMGRITRTLFDRDPRLGLTEENLKKQGYEIISITQVKPRVQFEDLGALVFYINLFKEDFPEFNLTTYQEKLLSLQEEIDTLGYWESSEHYKLYHIKKAAE